MSSRAMQGPPPTFVARSPLTGRRLVANVGHLTEALADTGERDLAPAI